MPHTAQNPKLLRVGRRWRDAHYLPNGWGRRCWGRQVSRPEAARLGGEKPAPAADPVARTNKRTGEVQEVDRRLDPARATNLDKHRSSALRDALNGRIAGWSAEPSTQRAAVQTVLGSPILDGFLDEVRRFRHRHPGANEVPRRIKDRIGEMPVAVAGSTTLRALGLNPAHAVIRLSPDSALKELVRHPEIDAAIYRRLPDLIERAEPLPGKNARTLVYFAEINGRLYRAAVKATRSHEIYLTTLHRAKPRDRRRARQRAASVQRERER